MRGNQYIRDNYLPKRQQSLDFSDDPIDITGDPLAADESEGNVKEVIDAGSIDVKAPNHSANVQQSGVSKAGDAAMAGGMATANPYVLAAGLALKTIGAAKDRRMKKAAKEADIKNEHRKALVARMSQLGSGVGSMGA